MNTLVAFALLCCMLPTANCLFGKLLTMITEPDDFCDEGPPGRYCLMDLSGWHDCHVDPNTGKMVDTIHNCPSNTRCACFYGPSCPGYLDDPCQPFTLPPLPPDKFTMYYNAYQRQCSPTGCVDSYYSGREIQSLTEFKKRDDSYEKYWATTFVLPGGNGSSFVQTNVRWDEQICQSDQIKAFPETSVPPYFSFNGKVKVGYRLCDKWIWRTGGHNPGQATSLTAYYIANKTIDASGANKDPYVSVMDPVKYEIMFNSGPVGKTSMYLTFNITSFLAGKADEEQLKLPDFCKT